MEQQRTHVLEWTDWFKRVLLNTTSAPASYVDPRSVKIEPAPKAKKGKSGKHMAKLNPEKVQEIRTALQEGEPIADIAARYHVSMGAITQLRDGRTWWDVE
jgi:hypothetical protein